LSFPDRSRAIRRSRPLDGILLLDKPCGPSSNQALQTARRLFGAAKAGHTGSLDPLATGLLPVCFGEATKIAGLLLGSRKAYATTARLGVVTDSADATGAITAEYPVPALDEATIERALADLRGRIRQIPPIYSAIKRDGEPLYRLARRGETVDVPEREVEVSRLDLIGREGDCLHLHVECGSGTYVRSLVRDLGAALGCGAHVTRLRRLWVEPFFDPVMVGFEQIEALAAQGPDQLDRVLLPISAGLAGYPGVDLDEADGLRLRQGQAIPCTAPAGRCVARGPDGQILALAEVGADGLLRSVRGFNLSREHASDPAKTLL